MTSQVDADVIRKWLLAAVGESLGVALGQVAPRASFRQLGLDSLAAGALASRLSAWLGRPVPLPLLWEHPSIAALATHLARGEAAEASSPAPRGPVREPIAIVGMACRFPGGADTPAAFWELLCSGRDAVGGLPRERFGDVDALPLTSRQGGFLRDVAGFEPSFFGISPREARHMDPQQRVVLELAWEALEAAGIPPLSLAGSATGVFLGACWSDFALLLGRLGLEAIEAHSVTGVHHGIIANRVSYFLGLEGPSMTVDTACSASLVAVHQACESLRGGESTLALAGGVNLILAPDSLVQMSRFGAASPTGRCRAFDAAGDGYVRAEGAGLVVLKPLSRALADGNPIWCVLRGSATNNDGRSNGLTAPSPRAQRAVLSQACARAGVEPASVAYVEAHGTGTRLGDPIEASALGAVYGQGRPAERPLRIGSVKSNIGHTEAAAGVAGLMKLALGLHHGRLPPSLHFHTPNPEIDFAALRLEVQTRAGDWPAHEGPLRAGVSSFGFGGSNAHALLEAVRPPSSPRRDGESRATGARPVFVFAGHGSQWLGMGRELWAASSVFRARLQDCERRIRAHTGWSLVDELLAPPEQSRLHETDVAQPAIFAMQVALAGLWRSWGVVPGAVVGHSLGEVAAAHVAGALSLDDAVRLVCLRGRLTRRLVGQGGILLLEGSREDAEAWLRDAPEASLAVCNSPRSTALSGSDAVLERLAVRLRAAGVRCTRVDIAFPSHSALVEPILGEFVEGLAGLSAQPPRIPLLSTVTGELVGGRTLGPAYWARNLREPVAFASAIETLARRGETLFLEVGPRPALGRFVEQCLAHQGQAGRVVTSTLRDAPEWEGVLAAVEALRAEGVQVRPGGAGDEASAPPYMVPVSARTPGALRERLAGLVALLDARPELPLEDLSYTAACGRSHLEHRVAAVGRTHARVREQLAAALVSVREGQPTPLEPPRLAFVFPGQGGLWAGMGRELMEGEPVFRHAFLACDEALSRHLGESVAERLVEGVGDEAHADVAQPLLFAFQVALCRLWESLGVRAAAVVGHSMGEVVAAHVAGALSLEDAARVICARSRQLEALKDRGSMALLEGSREECEAALKPWSGRASIAAYNGPRGFTLSGEREALEAIVAGLRARGAFARMLGEAIPPSHSSLMEPLRQPLTRALEGLAPRRATVALYSTTTGAIVEGPELGAEHWVRNVLQPVRFHEQVSALLRDGVTVLLEVGPHPLLGLACEQILAEAGAGGAVLHSLRRGEGAHYLYESLARLYGHGVEVDWRAVRREGGRILPLPAYPWQRVSCWPEGLSGGGPGGVRKAEPAPVAAELLQLEQRLRATAPEPDTVEPLLRHHAMALLQVSESALPSGASLKRLGLDSLLAMQLNNRMRALLRAEVPVALYLEDRGLGGLARALCEHVRQARAPLVSAEALAAALEEGGL